MRSDFFGRLLSIATSLFDIFAIDFTSGLTASNLTNVLWLTENFRPLILVKYLADFPNGLIQIFLVSLIPGVLIFFLQDIQ